MKLPLPLIGTTLAVVAALVVTAQAMHAPRKPFKATAEGEAHLEENRDEVDALFERLESHGHRRRRGNRPEIGRAVQNLMAAMRNRVMREGWNESLLDDVTEILDDAAKRIERLK